MKRVVNDATLIRVAGSFPSEYEWAERLSVASSPENAPTLADYLAVLDRDGWEIVPEHEVPIIRRQEGGTILRYDLEGLSGATGQFNYMIVWAA